MSNLFKEQLDAIVNSPANTEPTDYTNMESYFDSPILRKRKEVEDAAAKKKAELAQQLPATAEELFKAKPDTTPEEFTQWRNLRTEQIAARRQMENLQYIPEKAEDYAGDALGTLAKGVVQVGQGVYETANQVSKLNPTAVLKNALSIAGEVGRKENIDILKNIDVAPAQSLDQGLRKLGIAPDFGRTTQILNETMMSTGAKQSQQRIEDSKQLWDMAAPDRKAEMDAAGMGPRMQAAAEVLKSFGTSIAAYASEPAAAIDAALTSLPQYIGAGAAGKIATKGLSMATTAGKLFAEKISEAAVIAYTGMSEGGGNASQVKEEFYNLKKEELTDIPGFKEMEQRLGFEDARSQIAEQMASEVYLVSGVAAALIGKVSGASKFEGSLFASKLAAGVGTKMTAGELVKSALEGTVKSTLGIGKEFLEEGAQSFTGAVAGNLANQRYVDPKQALLEDAGWEAGSGAIAGALSVPLGSVVIGAAGLVKAAPSPKQVAELLKAGKDSVKAIVAENRIDAPKPVNMTKKMAQFADKTEADIKPETTPADALAILLAEKNVPKEPAQQAAHFDKLKSQYDRQIASLTDLQVKIEEDKFATPEDRKAAETQFNQLEAETAFFREKVVGYKKAVGIVTNTNAPTQEEAKAAIETADTEEKMTEVYNKTFGSEEGDTLDETPVVLGDTSAENLGRIRNRSELIDTALRNPNLTKVQKEVLEAQQELYKLGIPAGYEETGSGLQQKNSYQVSSEVFNGGNGFLGINGYIRDMRNVVAEKTPKSLANGKSLLFAINKFKARQSIKLDNVTSKINSFQSNSSQGSQDALASMQEYQGMLAAEVAAIDKTKTYMSKLYAKRFGEEYADVQPSQSVIDKLKADQAAKDTAFEEQQKSALGKRRSTAIDSTVNLLNARDKEISTFKGLTELQQRQNYAEHIRKVAGYNESLGLLEKSNAKDPEVKAKIAEARKGQLTLLENPVPPSIMKLATEYDKAVTAGNTKRATAITDKMAKEGLAKLFSTLIKKPPVDSSTVGDTVAPVTGKDGATAPTVPVGPGKVYVKQKQGLLERDGKPISETRKKNLTTIYLNKAKDPVAQQVFLDTLDKPLQDVILERAGKPVSTTAPTVAPTPPTPPVDTPEGKAPVKDIATAIRKNPKGIPQRLVEKDAKKAESATQFIGTGSPKSSTAIYAKLFDKFANTGNYKPEDKVFVSLNGGNSSDRVSIKKPNGKAVLELLKKAVAAGSTIIADNATNRSNGYNTGELELVEFLSSKEVGYAETNGDGIWKPVKAASKGVTYGTVTISSKAEEIYSTLGNKTQSKNVVLPKDVGLTYSYSSFWSTFVPALLVKHANAVIAFRKSNGKSYADNFKDDANGSYAIGNPFNWKDENGSRKEQGVLATKKFIDWLVTGNAFGNTDASEAYRNLILDNIKNGNLKDKAIGYFQEGGYPTHATALDYLVNEYNWGFKPVTEEVTPAPIVETVTEATLTSSRLAVLDKLLAEPDKAAELSAKETETLNATEDEASRLRVLNRIALEHGWEGEVGTTASLNIKDTNIIGDALNNAMADANGKAIIKKLFGHKFNSKNVLHLVKNALTDPVQYQALYDVMNPSQQYSLTMLKNFHDQMFPLIRNVLGFANKTGLPFRDANPAEYLYSKELQAIYDAAEDKSNIPLRVRHAKTQFIEDNLVSAMVLSAYSWIGEGSSKTLENYYDSVQKILGYKKDEVLPKGAMEEFRYVGLVTTSLIESLGKDAMKIMGLTKLATTEEGLTNKMPMALGTYIHLAMLEAGLVTINTVPNATIDKFAKQSSKKTEFSIVNPDGSVRETKQIHTEYTRVKVLEFKLDGQVQIEVDPQVQQHIDAVRTSRSLLSEFFGAPKKETWPSLKPLKKAANRIRNSMMQMPEIIRKAVQKMQEAAWQVDLDRWSLFNFMDTPTQEAFVGVVSDEVLLTQKHIAERDKIEATNFGYRRELANWQDFISKLVQVPKTGLNTPFFFKAVGIRNGRFMINSNTVNPEASKIHRFLMNMKAWQVEIPADKNSKLYKNFIMAVGLSFGVKLDEMEPDAAINESLKRMRDPIMIEAMEWIKAARSTNYQMDAEQKAEMQASLIKAMKLGGEKMHTFAALEAMSHMEKGKPFKTSLFMEVDGKTNGPAIAMYQYLGFPMSKFRAASDRVGIYSDGTQTYAEWKGNRPDSFDSYQQLAVWMGGAFNTLLQNHKPRSKLATRKAEYEFAIKGKEAAFANLRSMIGEFTERDVNTRLIKISSKIRTLHKPPVMTNVYGIGFGKLVDEYVEGLIAQLYVDLRTAYLKGEEDKVTSILKAIAGSVDSLNSTTNPDGSVDDEFTFQNQADLNDKGVMEWQLNAEQHKALNAFLTATYGNALGVVFDQQYKQFINNRKTINDSMNAIFVVFKEVYYHRAKALVRKRVQAKYDALPEDKKSAAARKILEKNTTLTFEEISTLRTEMLNLTPLFKGPFSSSDPNNHMDSVLLLKDKQKVRVKDDMEDEYAYKAMVKVTDEYGNTREIPQYASKGTFEQPGASPGVLGVQTIDAAAQALQQIMHDNIMNLFDANAMALDKIDSTEEGMGVVESFNKHLYEIGLRDYRLRMAVAASLERVVAALKNEPTHIQEKANDAFLELGLKDSNWNEYGSLQSFTEDMSDKAAADNQQINTLVKRISHMSHFPFPGTSYEVPRNTSTETVVAEIGELVQEAKKEVILQEIITRYKSYRQFDRYKFTTLERILRMHYEGKQPTKKDRKIYDMVARELLLDWLQEQPLTRFVLPTNFKDTYLSRQNFERALDVVVAGLKVNKEYAESIQRVAKEFKGVAGTVTQSAAVAPTAPTVPTAPAVTTRQSPEQQAAEQSAKYVKFLLDTDAFSEFSETVVAKAVELNYKYSNIDDVKNEKSRNFVRKIRAAIRAYEEFEEQVFLDRLGKPPLDTKIFNSEAKYAATQAANEIGTEAEILRERAELNALLNRGRGTTTSRTASTSQSTSTEAPVHTEGPFRGQKMTPIEIALQNAQRNMDAEFAAEEQAMKDQMDAFNKRMGRSPARFTEEDLLKEREAAKEAARNKNTLGSAPGTPVNRADFAGQTGTVLDSSNVQRELQSMFNMGAQKDSATHKERLEKVVREIGGSD
jgi:hypothetical protein